MSELTTTTRSDIEAAVSSIITPDQNVNNSEGPSSSMVVQEVEEEVELGYHHQEGSQAPHATHQVIVTSESSSVMISADQPIDHNQEEEDENAAMSILSDPLGPSQQHQHQHQRTQIVSSAGTVVAVTTSNVQGQGSAQRVNQKQVVVHQVPQQPQKFQDVRVDNWGNYCLQRLQLMYDRGDFCDLTLLFQTDQELKVHRVVVNLCTEYFANLERTFGAPDKILALPKDIQYEAMVTIIKFFYTGKLEIRGTQFNEVYRTVKLMNITILIKLLEAHAKKPVAQAKKEPNRPIVFKQAVEIGRPLQKGQGHSTHQLTGTPVNFSGATSVSIQGAGGTTKTLQVTTPGAKLPPGVKTKTVLARVQPQSVRIAQQNPNKSGHQKKLPIWKERKYSPANQVDPLMMDKWPIKDEPARPTRFEWGDPEDDPSFLAPVVSHALMDKQKVSNSGRKLEDIFDAVKNQNLAKRNLMSQDKSQNKAEQPPLKMIKLEPNSHQNKTHESNTMHHPSDSDHVNLTDETVEEEVSTSEAEVPHAVRTPILKPALKSQSYSRLTQMVGSNDPNLGNIGKGQEIPTTSGSSRASQGHSKSVRFAPEIEKENSKGNDIAGVININNDDSSSHSRIIAEVLKKYPDIVKDKQNIKLKIVSKGADSSTNKEKSKVSYIVLKSTSAPDTQGAVLLKKPTHQQTAASKAFWDKPEKKISGAENTTGPWLCGPCGGGEETPMEFETYYVYRKHLVEVHGERIDARICEYCGQKSSKRNLLMYHLLTKHGIDPPKNTHFPTCDKCEHVALSESLLNKHKLSHDATKEYSCHICNASFKSSPALQAHMSANLHRTKDSNVYECPYCRKPFVRNINLKAHIRSVHKDIARIEEMDDPRLPLDESIANRSSSSISAGNKKRQFPAILDHRTRTLQGQTMEILPHGHDGTEGQVLVTDGHTIEILHSIDPNSMSMPMTFVPSSEAEALTNVASSIAASLGLEAQGVHGTTEYMTGVASDGSPTVYIMDNAHPAVEVDINDAMGLAAEGTMIYDGDDPSGQGQFIVQDIHGNQFRKMTGIDENGKPVIFFQLSEENGQMTMAPTMLDDGMQMTAGTSSVFVSSGMTMPVTVSSDGTGQHQQAQVLLTTAGHDGTVYEMVSTGQDSHHHHHQHMVMSEGVLASEQTDGEAHHHHYHQEILPGQIEHGQTVQELHIVLDPNENSQGAEGQEQHGVIHEDESHIHQEHHEEDVQENYEQNGECIQGIVEETVTEEEMNHTDDQQGVETLEVQTVQEVSHDNLDESEASSNIMIVEEVHTEGENHHQNMEMEDTQEGQEETDSGDMHIHQEDTQEIEIEGNNGEVETQEIVSSHEEEVHMVADEEEHEHHTEGVDDEMLVEEVTGEPLSMVEEEVGQEEEIET